MFVFVRNKCMMFEGRFTSKVQDSSNFKLTTPTYVCAFREAEGGPRKALTRRKDLRELQAEGSTQQKQEP